jgi:hypothetical protein
MTSTDLIIEKSQEFAPGFLFSARFSKFSMIIKRSRVAMTNREDKPTTN